MSEDAIGPAPGAAHEQREIISRAPEERLRSYVRRYQGYRIDTSPLPHDRHVPTGDVSIIISFAEGFCVTGPDVSPDLAQYRNTFVAGLHETYSDSLWLGESSGVQVDFSPIGAHLFLGLPMHDLANRVIELDDVLGPPAALLVERLQAAPSWDDRFRLLNSVIARRLAGARASSPPVVWAWNRIARTAGDVSITSLAEDIGWSRKHLIARFREQVGLPPKTLARVLRFDRAVRRLERSEPESWAAIAAACGYYDQAHLVRDFRAFAGVTPGEFLRRRRADGGFSAE